MARGLLSFAILSLGLHVCLFGVVSSNHLRSLTLSWKATDESSKVDINWRFSFSRSWGSQVCDESDISNGTLIDVGEHLECQQCSNNEIARIKYQCTDYSQAEDWQTGEGSSRLTIEPGITAFDLLYSGCCWMTLGNAGAGYSAQAHVDLTQNRGVINSSPMTSWMPETRIQLGCETTLTIPMSDPDGDVVKCRWASGTNESGSVSPMPNSTLDESTCSLSIGDRLMSGWYAVALMIEDFASPMSTTAKSKIPLQFVVNVYYSYDACDERPTLIHPTPGQGSCRGASPGEIFSLQIRAKASISPILEIETSSPIGMTTSDVSLVPGKSNEYYITAMWTPDESQTGAHIFCFDALDSEGHTSEVRCINLVVGEPPKVIETSPVEGSTIPTSLGVLTFKFDQPINLISISTSVFVQSLYGMNMYTGSVTQTSPDTIQIQLSGTLYVDVAYSITLMEGTVQSRGACPFMSARHIVNVYTTWQTPAWTTDSFYTAATTVTEDGTTPFLDYWNTTPFEGTGAH
ncbi:uncharacterized protein LOC110989457 [Acanthaster planci]|uniref:Uncharacterized protein LOC110989457 n=1 Tax=Acanthaster planci TaxID=133434 RepID=A0A8B7ZWR9_ACAPL|nr:uncharacterized protein LOC110989457 [Acanthaster planci]